MACLGSLGLLGLLESLGSLGLLGLLGLLGSLGVAWVAWDSALIHSVSLCFWCKKDAVTFPCVIANQWQGGVCSRCCFLVFTFLTPLRHYFNTFSHKNKYFFLKFTLICKKWQMQQTNAIKSHTFTAITPIKTAKKAPHTKRIASRGVPAVL